MAIHLAFSGFQTIIAPSQLVSNTRSVSACQRRSHAKASSQRLPASAAFMTMSTSLNQNKSAVSNAVREANTVIVGGGPTGLLAAILLAHRNVPVTVIEQDDDLSRFDPLKAYALGISHHGMGALNQLPSLLEAVRESGVPYNALRQVNVDADGTLHEFGRGMRFQGSCLRIFHNRVSIVEVLQSYSKTLPNITLLKQTKVVDVRYDHSGMDVFLNSAEQQHTIRTKLLLACDGKNSIVSKTLRQSEGGNSDLFQSSQGLGEDSIPTKSSGKLVKSITIAEKFVVNNLTSAEEIPDKTAVIHRLIPKKGVAANKAFWFTVFPMNAVMSNRCGGRIATTVQPATSELWSVKTVDEGYELFEEVLPQLHARENITPENMKKFVEAKALRLPNSTCLDSLVVHVGSGGSSGGIIFLGDAAHSFPPDVGQGLNSAFEDVQVLMNVLDTCSSDCKMEDIVEKYEMERASDVKALLQYVRRITGFAGDRVSGPQAALRTAESKMRGKLSKWLPNWFSPSLVELMSRDCSYSEAIRLYDETTVRLWAVGISLVAVPVIGVVAIYWH